MSPIVQIEEEIKKLRRLLTVLHSNRFEQVYKVAPQSIKDKIDQAVKSRDDEALKILIPDPSNGLAYEDRPITYLRVIARGLGIEYYSRKDKITLIAEIRTCEQQLQRDDRVDQACCPVGGLGRVPS